ncbi:hypothetical protein J1614_009991 [Plenodomus biglobosus]|nr:hypothetical protein J1614_009991 [Plenodomus biglobosus]
MCRAVLFLEPEYDPPLWRPYYNELQRQQQEDSAAAYESTSGLLPEEAAIVRALLSDAIRRQRSLRRNNREARSQDRRASEGEGIADNPLMETSLRLPQGGTRADHSTIWGRRRATANEARSPILFSSRGGRAEASGNPVSARGMGYTHGVPLNPFSSHNERHETSENSSNSRGRGYRALPNPFLSRGGRYEASANPVSVRGRGYTQNAPLNPLPSYPGRPETQGNPSSGGWRTDTRSAWPNSFHATTTMPEATGDHPSQRRRALLPRPTALMEGNRDMPYNPPRENCFGEYGRGHRAESARQDPFFPDHAREHQNRARSETFGNTSLPDVRPIPFQTRAQMGVNHGSIAPNNTPRTRDNPPWATGNWRESMRTPFTPGFPAQDSSMPSASPVTNYTPPGTESEYTGWARRTFGITPLGGQGIASPYPAVPHTTLGPPPGLNGGLNRSDPAHVLMVLGHRQRLVAEHAMDEVLTAERREVERTVEEGSRNERERGSQDRSRGPEESESDMQDRHEESEELEKSPDGNMGDDGDSQ